MKNADDLAKLLVQVIKEIAVLTPCAYRTKRINRSVREVYEFMLDLISRRNSEDCEIELAAIDHKIGDIGREFIFRYTVSDCGTQDKFELKLTYGVPDLTREITVVK